MDKHRSVFKAESEQDMHAIAAELAKEITSGTVITLTGDLGAGKTTFAKGFAQALGITDTVTSPTFPIVLLYPIDNTKTFVHIDAYRIEDESEVMDTGIPEYLANPHAIVLIEWPSHIIDTLKSVDVIRITITINEDNSRIVEVLK